jgi:hypothetical protein
MLEITRDLPKGRPTSIYKHPIQIEPLYPFTGSFRADRTRRSKLTGRAQPRPILQRSLRQRSNPMIGRASQNDRILSKFGNFDSTHLYILFRPRLDVRFGRSRFTMSHCSNFIFI